MKSKCLVPLFFILLCGCNNQKPDIEEQDYVMDLRYAPLRNQTSINLPDEVQKTVVDETGQMYYDYINFNRDGKWINGPFRGFNIAVGAGLDSIENQSLSHRLLSSKVPIVITQYSKGSLAITIENFAVAPGLKTSAKDSCEVSVGFFGLPHNDFLTLSIKNSGPDTVISPKFFVNAAVEPSLDKNNLKIQKRIHIQFPEGAAIHKKAVGNNFLYVAELNPVKIKSGSDTSFTIPISIGEKAVRLKADKATVNYYRNTAIAYWNQFSLPYESISVPDSNVQNLAQSCIRNIYQAREIKNGLPAFQVGPTCYRGLWIVDGAFLLESMTFLGQIKDVRNGIEYMLGFQRPNGSFELIEKHWKETGIVLWAITRHAKLTGDKSWLHSKWEKVIKAVSYIDTMRFMTMKDKNAPHYGLIPEGFSDGGLAKVTPEYTNIYWTLNGLKAAADAAVWLGKTQEAQLWKAKYDTMFFAFRKAAERDLRTDSCGNKAIPVFMKDSCQIQRAQWAFCHAVHPGKNFSKNDPLLIGNMNMLQCYEKEGMVYETGWLNKGIWNYFGSFYAHAWLWMGDGQKAAQIMYAMANHASSTWVWREEQPLTGSTIDDKPRAWADGPYIGDMPHNWASAEFIRMVRDFIVIERETELHLFEALPPSWIKPGMATRLKGIYTEFGVIDVEFIVSKDGKTAEANINLNSERHEKPLKVIIHQEIMNNKKALSLNAEFPIHKIIDLKK